MAQWRNNKKYKIITKLACRLQKSRFSVFFFHFKMIIVSLFKSKCIGALVPGGKVCSNIHITVLCGTSLRLPISNITHLKMFPSLRSFYFSLQNTAVIPPSLSPLNLQYVVESLAPTYKQKQSRPPNHLKLGCKLHSMVLRLSSSALWWPMRKTAFKIFLISVNFSFPEAMSPSGGHIINVQAKTLTSSKASRIPGGNQYFLLQIWLILITILSLITIINCNFNYFPVNVMTVFVAEDPSHICTIQLSFH